MKGQFELMVLILGQFVGLFLQVESMIQFCDSILVLAWDGRLCVRFSANEVVDLIENIKGEMM